MCPQMLLELLEAEESKVEQDPDASVNNLVNKRFC